MKILALRADAGGCAHYRIQLPARAATIADGSIQVEVRADVYLEGERDRNGYAKVHEVKEDVDLIIFQRPLDNAFCAVIEQAQRQGIACVVELDDDFANVHPRNMVWQNVQPDHFPHSNYVWLQEACLRADLVTVSTPELLKYAPHGRSAVLPNFVSRDVLDIRPALGSGAVRIGWSGTLQTHPNDLQETRPGLAQAVRDTGASVYVVGDGAGVREALGVAKSVPFGSSGWTPLGDYMQTMADNVDVGVVPLEDTPFNRAKSWLKGLEFAALGIPFIASPLPEYRVLADNNLGLLAHTPSEWRKLLRTLIESETYREDICADYRETVSKYYVAEDRGDLWVNAWREALNNRAKS